MNQRSKSNKSLRRLNKVMKKKWMLLNFRRNW